MDNTPPTPWEPVQRMRAHEQVMSQIEQRILAGQLRAGDHLPNERDLAAHLGVSRSSLRESLRVLEALGVMEIRRGGDGGAVLVDSPGEGFVNLLKLQIALAHFSTDDVLDTRLALETWCCREAAVRRTDEDLVALTAILDEMDAEDIQTAEFNRLDAAFHVRIAESTGNRLGAHLMQSLRTAINRQMIEAYARLADWRATAQVVRREHREILERLRAQDPDGASAHVHEHITSFYRESGESDGVRADPGR
ncbi:FadR family transcriptional regulator [Microbacterium lushaniae]|nr:FadR family transcriptional regulator [Microbacterium lushaniae]KAA9155232.1 FadR family transcriptional regulator [Microbacterium lushaniae]